MAVKVTWNKAALSELLKTDPGVTAALMSAGQALAAKNSAASLSLMHSPQNRPPYVAEHRVLTYTQVVTVHSTTKAAAAVGRAHGLPTK